MAGLAGLAGLRENVLAAGFFSFFRDIDEESIIIQLIKSRVIHCDSHLITGMNAHAQAGPVTAAASPLNSISVADWWRKCVPWTTSMRSVQRLWSRVCSGSHAHSDWCFWTTNVNLEQMSYSKQPVIWSCRL